MRSPAEQIRIERVLRVTGLVALAAWIANAARPALTHVDVASDASLRSSLVKWTRTSGADSVHIQLDTVPSGATRDWMAALRATGVGVSWSSGGISSVALEASAAGEPSGGVVVRSSSPASEVRVLGDALGTIDTLRGATTSVRLASVEGDVILTSGRQPAKSPVPSPQSPKRLLVVGAASWEAKFVIAALEESGWTVDAHLFLAPDHDVTQGSPAALDTARYAAAIFVDSAGAEWARGVEAFVRNGGGLVLAGDASAASRVAPLLAWRTGKHEKARLGTVPGDTAWRGLSRVPLEVSGTRAITIERRGDHAALVARRYHAGRVIGVGYDQTWRWRMAGGDSSRVEHRDWWSRVVASVVQPVSKASGAAPLAQLFDVLGPPSAAVSVAPVALTPAFLSNLLGALALGALLSEWMLRRSRGGR
jgi:hypothetical protein